MSQPRNVSQKLPEGMLGGYLVGLCDDDHRGVIIPSHNSFQLDKKARLYHGKPLWVCRCQTPFWNQLSRTGIRLRPVCANLKYNRFCESWMVWLLFSAADMETKRPGPLLVACLVSRGLLSALWWYLFSLRRWQHHLVQQVVEWILEACTLVHLYVYRKQFWWVLLISVWKASPEGIISSLLYFMFCHIQTFIHLEQQKHFCFR